MIGGVGAVQLPGRRQVGHDDGRTKVPLVPQVRATYLLLVNTCARFHKHFVSVTYGTAKISYTVQGNLTEGEHVDNSSDSVCPGNTKRGKIFCTIDLLIKISCIAKK